MMNSLYSAATGMSAQQMQLDVIANNLANVNTTGYKASRVGFEDLVYQAVGSRQSALLGSQVGMGAAPGTTSRMMSQGALISTENPLSVAIDGRGFFQVQDGAEIAYTRAGDFRIDANGQVVTSSGNRLVPPIQVPQGANQDELTIGPDGQVSVKVGNTIQVLGVLTTADFVNTAGLEAVGQNLYKATANSGPPLTAQPATNGLGQLVQGTVEQSNVTVMSEMVNMITAQRAFEGVSRVISASDEMLQMANAIRR